MKMPNNDLSIVEDKKITDYLLNDTHDIGKQKSNFFKRFGFDISDIKAFKKCLIQHSIQREVEQTIITEYGEKFILKCEIETPDQRNPCIVTVWLIEKGKQIPRLLTAYPTN